MARIRTIKPHSLDDGLRVSAKLNSSPFPETVGDPVSDPFSLMNALVAGATNDGLCFADPSLMRRYAWWEKSWDALTVRSWTQTLVEWGEVTVEPLGRNCYGPNKRFDVIVIQNKQRFKRWHPRPSFTTAQRVEVYARDGGMCRHCETTEDLSIDHIQPWSKGGAHEMWNFQTLCRSCNSSKGNR